MPTGKCYDVAVIGAGVFGSWTALQLARLGRRVLLLDAYGPGHSRSSSGDESRIIRMGYGADEIYTQWSLRSLAEWKKLFAAGGNDPLFQKTGVLWLANENNEQWSATRDVLGRNSVRIEELSSVELKSRYPQFNFEGITGGIYEPESGVLLARRAVAATVAEAVRLGVDFKLAAAKPPAGTASIEFLQTSAGEEFEAKQFVFACGAWLKKLFPDVLGPKIFPTRQCVFYIGLPAGNSSFTSPLLPTWLFKNDECYGMPDIEGRGLKIALDRHGEPADPDSLSRIPTSSEVEEIRRYIAYRFPALTDAPIAESRVCQYENTSSGDFLIDRHPQIGNVWFAGGGSGHGFKHGPALGEYVASQLHRTAAAQPRFQLQKKDTVQKRAVY